MCRGTPAACTAGVHHQFCTKTIVKFLRIPGRLLCNIQRRKKSLPMSFLLPVHRKLCLGFYCTGLVTALILLCLFSLLYVDNEFDKMRRNAFPHIKKYLPLQVNLPTTFIYEQGHLEIVKKEDNMIVYKNTIEDDILSLSWVKELYQILNETNSSASTLSPQINLVVADKKCVDLLLNWLIASLVRLSEPLRNVVVLGLDQEVCKLIKPRNISCIHSNPMTFMRSQMSKDFRFQPVYSAPQTRLLVARLVSYWRYSFASYDTDALVLRNPQPLYERYRDVNVIAGASVHWPQWAGELWGFSMCLGAFMIRSSPETGKEVFFLFVSPFIFLHPSLCRSIIRVCLRHLRSFFIPLS